MFLHPMLLNPQELSEHYQGGDFVNENDKKWFEEKKQKLLSRLSKIILANQYNYSFPDLKPNIVNTCVVNHGFCFLITRSIVNRINTCFK